jgi:5-methylcytosine-specific restriction endonuclease McrA
MTKMRQTSRDQITSNDNRSASEMSSSSSRPSLAIQAQQPSTPTRKRVPRGTYRNHAEAARAWRERNSDKFRMSLRKWKYSRLKYAAKRRGIEFSLSQEDFLAIIGGARCHYCGGPLPDFGHGIDRKDSASGYTKDNVVPCCYVCNTVKGHQLSHTEMLEIGSAVARIWLRRLHATPGP